MLLLSCGAVVYCLSLLHFIQISSFVRKRLLRNSPFYVKTVTRFLKYVCPFYNIMHERVKYKLSLFQKILKTRSNTVYGRIEFPRIH